MGHLTLFVESQRVGLFCCNTLEEIRNIHGVPLLGVQEAREEQRQVAAAAAFCWAK